MGSVVGGRIHPMFAHCSWGFHKATNKKSKGQTQLLPVRVRVCQDKYHVRCEKNPKFRDLWDVLQRR